jgi:hypothetical protein
VSGRRDPDPNLDPFTSWLLHLASDLDWPALSVEARVIVPAGRRSWLRFLEDASRAEKMLAGRALRSQARLNGRRSSALWR